MSVMDVPLTVLSDFIDKYFFSTTKFNDDMLACRLEIGHWKL